MKKGKLKTGAMYGLAIAAMMAPFAVSFAGIGTTITGISQKVALKEEIIQEFVEYQRDNINEWTILYQNGLLTKEEFDNRIQKQNSQEVFLLVSDSDIVKEYNKAQALETNGLTLSTTGLAIGGAALATAAAVAISKGRKMLKQQDELENELKKSNEEIDAQLAKIDELEGNL